jgi:hypothetical protein
MQLKSHGFAEARRSHTEYAFAAIDLETTLHSARTATHTLHGPKYPMVRSHLCSFAMTTMYRAEPTM